MQAINQAEWGHFLVRGQPAPGVELSLPCQGQQSRARGRLPRSTSLRPACIQGCLLGKGAFPPSTGIGWHRMAGGSWGTDPHLPQWHMDVATGGEVS